jgi:hypothetical protein
MAAAIGEAVAQLKTKADLLAIKADLQAEIAAERAEPAVLRAELKAEIEILKRDMTIRLGSMMIVTVGVILAGFKLIMIH